MKSSNVVVQFDLEPKTMTDGGPSSPGPDLKTGTANEEDSSAVGLTKSCQVCGEVCLKRKR